MIIFWICFVIAWLPLRIFAPFRVRKACKLDKKNNYIVICNHQSNFDAILLDYSLCSRIRFLAKKELFQSVWSKFFLKSICGGVEIDRSRGLNMSQTKEVFSLLKKGQNVGIFPEGTREDSFEESNEIKGGACLFALKSNKPILPCYIVKKHRFFRRNTVLIGKPFELKVEEGKSLKEAISAGEIRLREEILALKNTYEDFVMQKELVKKLKKEKNNNNIAQN